MKQKVLNVMLILFYIFIFCTIVGIVSLYQKGNQKVQKLAVEKENVNLNYGQTYQAKVRGESSNDKLIWSSSDPSLVTVDSNGNIKSVANKDGVVTITAKTPDGTSEISITVTVKSTAEIIKVTGITLDKKEVTLKYGESTKINPNITPDNASNKTIYWSSNNEKLVAVDNNGNIKAIANKDGTATITAKSVESGITAMVKVTVTKVDNNIKVTGITLDKKEVTLKYGESTKINPNITPENATNKKIKWSSNNEKLVTVDDDGNIKAIANKDGTATITAKTIDGSKTATLKVSVKKVADVIKVTDITLDKKEVTLKYQETAKLKATVSPSSATNKAITWSSSNKNLVTVDSNGNIKAVGNKKGSATITAKTTDGNKKATVKVTVQDVVLKIKLEKPNVTINKGSKHTIKYAIDPSTASNKNITFTSNDTKVATVDSKGIITAKAAGKTTIELKSADKNASAIFTVTVKVPLKGLTLNKTNITLKKGETYSLVPTFNPTDATNKNITWTSSEPDLVSVDTSGKVKALKNQAGTVTIKAQAKEGGYAASVQVKVIQVIEVKSLKINKSNFQLKKGNDINLSYTMAPSNATDKSVTWSSSNVNVATVDKNGKVTAVGNGIATITVASTNGKKDSITMSVISSNDLELYKWLTDFKLNQNIQNFIVINNELYTTHKDAYLNRHNSNGMTCINFGTTQGHMDSIDYEVTNGVTYLWTGCNATEREGGDLFATNICRMKFTTASFNDSCKSVNPASITVNTFLRGNHFAIDNSNNTIIIRTTLTDSQQYRVYKLSDFIKNYNNEKENKTPKATALINVKIPYNVLPDGKTTKNIFQNIEYENGYFYIYEGLSSTHSYNDGGYIKVTKYKLNLSGNCSGNNCAVKKGSKIIKYQYSNSDWWQETEGIRVIGNELYIGISTKKRKENGKTTGNFAYEIYKVNGMGTY